MSAKIEFILQTLGLPFPRGSFAVGGEAVGTAAIEFAQSEEQPSDTLALAPGGLVFQDIELEEEDGARLKLETVLLDVTNDKVLETTQPSRRKRPVTEVFASGAHNVVIKGALVSKSPNVFPRNEFVRLLAIVDRLQSVRVFSEFLRLQNIYYLDIVGHSFPQRAGFGNMQIFELRCVSSEDDVLIERI